MYGAGIGLSRWGSFFKNFCVFLADKFVREAPVYHGAGTLHHLTLHQLSPTPSTLWRDWKEKKRQHWHITHQITGVFDRPYSKKHVAE